MLLYYININKNILMRKYYWLLMTATMIRAVSAAETAEAAEEVSDNTAEKTDGEMRPQPQDQPTLWDLEARPLMDEIIKEEHQTEVNLTQKIMNRMDEMIKEDPDASHFLKHANKDMREIAAKELAVLIIKFSKNKEYPKDIVYYLNSVKYYFYNSGRGIGCTIPLQWGRESALSALRILNRYYNTGFNADFSKVLFEEPN
jgi:polyhydroxyalkanoate synthesis regulator phasin